MGGFERVNVVRSLVVVREAQQAVLAGWPVDVEAAGQREGAGETRQHCRPLPGYRAADAGQIRWSNEPYYFNEKIVFFSRDK